MNQKPASPATAILTSVLLSGGLVLLLLLAWLTMNANAQTSTANSITSFPMHATHVLGFKKLRRNVGGDLSIDDGSLGFRHNGKLAGQISIASIQNISLGEHDKQTGGVPMMVGKAAVPFGGGRVVSLFSHKKFDSVAIDYRDSQGGLHGVIFQLPKGEGETLKAALTAYRGQTTPPEETAAVASVGKQSVDLQKWSVQVDRVDPGATALDACFSDAIYENLLRQLSESQQVNAVFREGDRNANDVSNLLVLKIFVEKYSPGSETRRAVTTVAGATKLKVRMQLVTPNGHVVLEQTIQGNVRFLGDNLQATNKLAKNAAKVLNRSTLPTPSSLKPQLNAVNAAAGL